MEKDFQSAPKRFWQTIRRLSRGKRGSIQAVYTLCTLRSPEEEQRRASTLMAPVTPRSGIERPVTAAWLPVRRETGCEGVRNVSTLRRALMVLPPLPGKEPSDGVHSAAKHELNKGSLPGDRPHARQGG
ncbi:hypothetical protein NHX12_001057 [Muraenolepis orangiensis]|uniref:Uncharacterized protein n=1 Tax=Muraenolepis orangiensis TaxID=630683 RepID=A0A9Q0IG96_9TELE|nr:hypothetical protein NHX12_001057 [Muraenolepis orangiensis]